MDHDKGFPLPTPIDGYDLICVRLKIPNDPTYRQDFLGHIWALGQWFNWEQSGIPGDTRAKQAGEYWRGLLYEHLVIEDCEMPVYPILRMNPENECQTQQSVDGGATWYTVFDRSLCWPTIPTPPIMIKFRQNPSNPQLLEQSFDGGATWSLAYDYSKYTSKGNTYNDNYVYNQSILNAITTINNEWALAGEDVTIFAPNMVFDDTPEDENRNAAICYACRVFVHAIMETAFANASNPSALDDLFGLVFTGISAGLGAFIGGPVGAAVGIFLGQGFIDLVRSSDIASRETYGEYEEDLICCMYTALKDSIPTQSAFEGSFGACTLPGPADEFVTTFVLPLLALEENFLAFLKLCSEGVDVGEFLPECPCEPAGDAWTILVVGGSDQGHITSQTLTNISASSGVINGDGFYRVSLENLEGCSRITSVGGTGAPGFFAKFYCAGGSATSAPLVDDELNKMYWASYTPFTVSIGIVAI